MTQSATAGNRGVLLQLSGISKSFPGVKALDEVTLTLREGEVHGLLGENGAGKSTLIKIIAGVYVQDQGTIRLDGKQVKFANPRQASAEGISVVHQERNNIPTFTVGENVLLDRIVGKSYQYIDPARIQRQAQAYLDLVGLDVSPNRGVETLSAAQKQLVQIARALSANSRLLLLDEPTASIAIGEVTMLMGIIRQLRSQGIAVLYVTHKLDEVFQICDTVTVLRDGRNVGSETSVANIDRNGLVTLMIGRSQAERPFKIAAAADREPILEVGGIRSDYMPSPCSFELYKGEILGWYGLVGAGRSELARAVIGGDIVREGSVRVEGRTARIRTVADALHRFKIGYVSENRQEEGLILIHSVRRNIAITVWKRMMQHMGLLNTNEENRTAERFADILAIKTPSLEQTVANLSGGNQQKVSVAKWLASDCRILIFDEPTVGIDVGTREEIHNLIRGLADSGVSIILISSDMREMIRLAERVLVFAHGVIIGEMNNTGEYAAMSEEIMHRLVAA
jgi:ribose transport system ATP-binding protein